jgi:hypothetical protein
VGGAHVMIPVLVNGMATELPAIHARGDYVGLKTEFFFLDDESNPLTLRFRIGIGAVQGSTPSDRDTLDVVRISYRCSGPVVAAGGRSSGSLEEALAKAGRAVVCSCERSSRICRAGLPPEA